MSADRRINTRYDISEVSKLKCALSPAPSIYHFLTLSLGGCGVWTPDLLADFGPTPNLNIYFTYHGVTSAQLHGQILYKYPQTLGGEFGQFIGIKFPESEMELLRPILEAIDRDILCRKEAPVSTSPPKKISTTR